MAKSIKQVKPKKLIYDTLTRKLRSYRKPKHTEQNLLRELVELDPIYIGREDKFNFDATREEWIKFHAEYNFKNKKNIYGQPYISLDRFKKDPLHKARINL